jgi:hypothetical protein
VPKQKDPGQKKPRQKLKATKRVQKAKRVFEGKTRHGDKKQDSVDVKRSRRKHKRAVADQRMGLQAEARQRNRAKGSKSKSNLARHAKLTD